MSRAQFRWLASLSLLFTTLSCDSYVPTELPDRENEGSIQGSVAADGEPLRGVVVGLRGTMDGATITDAQGRYRFGGLPSGPYEVGISEFPATTLFDRTSTRLKLYPGSWSAVADFHGAQSRGAKVCGAVTVEGLVLPGVPIRLSGPGPRVTVTDSLGEFCFDGVPAGPVSVTVSGFDPAIHMFPFATQIGVARPDRTSEFFFEGTNILPDDSPPKPAGLSATATDSTTVALTWPDYPYSSVEMRVERGLMGTRRWRQIETLPVGTSGYVDAGRAILSDYRYRLRACRDQACSPYTDHAVATTPGTGQTNLKIASLHLTQTVQTLDGQVPLVAGREAFLRIFLLAQGSNTLMPSIRVSSFLGGQLVRVDTLPSTRPSVPVLLEEDLFDGSWNLRLPASLIQPGLSILAEVDPDNSIHEPNEADNAFPPSGTPLPLDVRRVPPLSIVFVPVRQPEAGLAGVIDMTTGEKLLGLTRKLFPIAAAAIDVHSEYVSNTPPLLSDDKNGAWGKVLSEINALRVVEGRGGHYYGIVQTDYPHGISGIGYQGWPVAVGRGSLPGGSSTLAHELGHNWDRTHTPGCGIEDPDPTYPYLNGRIGASGLDLATEEIKSGGVFYDVMSYCGPRWISDYTFEEVLEYREARATQASSEATEPSLLLWGRVEESGHVLEPAFEVNTSPFIPSDSGAFILEGLTGNGEPLFSYAFDPLKSPTNGAGERHFAYAVPLRLFPIERLRTLRLSGGRYPPFKREPSSSPPSGTNPSKFKTLAGRSGGIEIQWDAKEYPMAMVRDPATGQVLTFARGGRAHIPASGREIEITFSNGTRSPEVIRRSWR